MNAKQVLDMYWNGELPVNSPSIAAHLGISVFYDPSLKCSGQLEYTLSGVFICCLNPFESPTRQLFTLAYYIAYVVLGYASKEYIQTVDFSRKYNSEKHTNALFFVIELLMPEQAILDCVTIYKINKLEQLASCFFVSNQAMKTRLEILKLI